MKRKEAKKILKNRPSEEFIKRIGADKPIYYKPWGVWIYTIDKGWYRTSNTGREIEVGSGLSIRSDLYLSHYELKQIVNKPKKKKSIIKELDKLVGVVSTKEKIFKSGTDNQGVFNEQNDTIVDSVREDLKRRSEVGIEKYGVTLDRKDIDLKGWLQHAYEECLDQALYLKRSIEEIETKQIKYSAIFPCSTDDSIKYNTHDVFQSIKNNEVHKIEECIFKDSKPYYRFQNHSNFLNEETLDKHFKKIETLKK